MPILEEMWEEVAVDLRKRCSKEGNNLYASQNIFYGMDIVNTAKYKFRHARDILQYGRCRKYGVSSLGHPTNGETAAFILVQILTKQLCSLNVSFSIK